MAARSAFRRDLVISDLHHDFATRGSVSKARGPAGEPCIAHLPAPTTCGRHCASPSGSDRIPAVPTALWTISARRGVMGGQRQGRVAPAPTLCYTYL